MTTSIERRLFAVEQKMQELELGRQEEVTARKDLTRTLRDIRRCLFGNGTPGLDEQVRMNTACRETFVVMQRKITLVILLGLLGLGYEIFTHYQQSL